MTKAELIEALAAFRDDELVMVQSCDGRQAANVLLISRERVTTDDEDYQEILAEDEPDRGEPITAILLGTC